MPLETWGYKGKKCNLREGVTVFKTQFVNLSYMKLKEFGVLYVLTLNYIFLSKKMKPMSKQYILPNPII